MFRCPLPRKGIPMLRRILYSLAATALVAVGVATAAPSAAAAPAGFVTRSGSQFMLGGQPFRYGGTNNYYLHYTSRIQVDDVFDKAQSMGLKVIRAWTFLECGGARPNSAGGCSQGTDHWMQRWSATTNSVEYNTGVTGLQQIDYMIDKANRTGIKLILVFAGNWKDFGGMDQYVTWYGLQNHDQFYTDARIRQDYKNWVGTLLNRTNAITGVQYKNDPTVFSWELANEPRCINASLPTSGTCTATTLTNWADEMSTFVKGIDPSHMVSIGDEGFHPGQAGPSNSWPYNVTDGVDHAALTALPNIDFGTYHMYPQGWGQTPVDGWSTGWITDHDSTGTALNKPEVLEEFGTTDQSTRDNSYRLWTDTVRNTGGAGFMVWILTGIQDTGSCTPATCPLYPDFDGFRVISPSSTATVLATAAAAIGGGTGGDTTPPSTPGTPTASNITTTGAGLTWTASTDNVGVTGYDVVQVLGTTETALVSTATNSATLTGLAAGTAYVVGVYARDAAGNRSTRSATVSFSTMAGTGGGGCRVTYTVNWTGGTGFGATATITNLGTAAIAGWTLVFTLPAGQGISTGWNGTWTTGSGGQLTVTSLSWNASIPAGGTLAQSPQFNGAFSGNGTPVRPAAFTLNGAACAIG
jgi:mannan endo-1,4-beta-mannosidase